MKLVVILFCAALAGFAQPMFAPPPPPPPAPEPAPQGTVTPRPPNPPDPKALSEEIRAKVAASLRNNRNLDEVYRSGTRFLDRGDWDRAAEMFTQVIERKGERMDGAYYWKAYAFAKSGKRDQALSLVSELERASPRSRWLDDARALSVELKQASGLAVSADVQNDEELKLIALNGLVEVAPERALLAVQELLKKSSSPRLKERALFVIAQSNAPQSREILAQYARGTGNPDLQLKAIEYLAMQRDNGQLLSEIYGSNTDTTVRRRVLQAYMMTRDKDRVFQAARTEQDVELRREAISLLGSMRAEPELLQLYSNENNQDLKKRIIHSMRSTNSAKGLIEIARKESSPELKREAVEILTGMRSKEATDFLMELLNK